jgi:hypothetical protein
MQFKHFSIQFIEISDRKSWITSNHNCFVPSASMSPQSAIPDNVEVIKRRPPIDNNVDCLLIGTPHFFYLLQWGNKVNHRSLLQSTPRTTVTKITQWDDPFIHFCLEMPISNGLQLLTHDGQRMFFSSISAGIPVDRTFHLSEIKK